ncbi:thiol-disulfide oxidoreductase ResA [Domibacillus robiginosus]|uniref:thiol-disulfide oxidoreductase ResA n=1 Tax=Domibacillus robiginosus TaxID=1071054 RepID=UPI00067E3141|nr:thiol-disulfide oxidoreductase ResA [Domibacillus robiginosus]
MDKKKQRHISRTIVLAILFIAVFYALYNNLTKETRGTLQKGDEAPDFVLTDSSGEQYQLSDYQGKGVFLNFWATWCEPCKKEMPNMEKIAKEYKGQVEVLAVNIGESEFQVNNFVEQYSLTFPILIDTGREVQKVYNVNPLPVTFMISPDGKVEDIIVGGLVEEDQVRALFEKVKPK